MVKMKSNPQIQGLIDELKKASLEQQVKLWKRIAKELEKPTRQQRAVNLSRISRYAKENETIVVPGKILGNGEISLKIAVASYKISKQALEKLKKAKCKYYSLSQLIKENPKGKKVRIIG